jgi:NAD(P)H-dependent FMN reductase
MYRKFPLINKEATNYLLSNETYLDKKEITMKLLAFAASNSRQSINKQLVTHAADVLRSLSPDIQVEVIDLNDYEAPLFSIDRETELGIPAVAQAFYDKITGADALLISFAEHNGSFTAAYKNAFDWASRIEQKVYQGKPAVYLATSPGPGGAGSVLNAAVGSAPYFAADVKASLSVPSFFDNFDGDSQRLTHEGLAKDLKAAVSALL